MPPDYKKIYKDMIIMKYPDKLTLCKNILEKENLSILDVIHLNELLFDSTLSDSKIINQRLRSYDKNSILEILAYQKKKGLNNIQLAKHFNLSRNTITKWKRLFFVNI
ncbi:hypothetical protein CLU97_1673 [Chryseobacterium sp. 7]|uniref:helix-turn-helix domain-containing protein n=1 Tax=Chryseobacterium sp. 7 TaxID=2035214 RepID=UPI000F14E108|nr:helix-turn-helix domain-containing protein [Chryseobacterium sp. 7]RLJ32224.1 hypothetical protein CLU97_1673 [Chryseobacterium sp. 7]